MNILILFIVVLICWYCTSQVNTASLVHIQKVDPVKWGRNTCKYTLGDVHDMYLKENGIKCNSDWAFYYPCDYNNIDAEISNMPVNVNTRYFILSGADQICGKHYMWNNIVAYHGLDKAKLIAPDTFVLSNTHDIRRLVDTHTSGQLYILKKNIQQQSGLDITDNIITLLKNDQKYVLAQKLLQDPYTIKGRKINLRIYVLVVCKQDYMNVYMYNDGFMYYTKKLFAKNSTDIDINVTTGYIDRKVYEENPLTHTLFKKYLDDLHRQPKYPMERLVESMGLSISDSVFRKIEQLIADVFVSVSGILNKKESKLYNNITFQLFGADVALSNELHPMIMEINKGPDLNTKSKNDGILKYNLIKDTYAVLKGDNYENTGFIKVLDIAKTTTKHVL
jgi:hypothetical protein